MNSDRPRTENTPIADDCRSNTLINALIGAVAGIILSFVPLSPLLGGAISGYLDDGQPRDGLRIGAIAGLIMLIPMVFMGMFIMMFFFGLGNAGAPIAFGMMAFFMLGIGAIYTVGLSAVGGYLGIYVKHEM